jgi:hypothetical protein
MKHLSYLLIVTISTVIACSSTKTRQNSPDIVLKNNNSLLWSIEKKGQPKSYLFGTMHLIEPKYFNFSDKLKNIIISSDQIIMEIGGEPNPLEAYELMRLDSGKITDYFTEEQFTELLNFFDSKLGVNPKAFKETYLNMKPFLILQTITHAYFSENVRSYDLTIMQLAKEHHKNIIGFETMEEQLSFFCQIPSNEMAELIMSSIKNFEKEKKETLKLQKMYAKQKVKKFLPLMKKQSPELMTYENLFLTNRNLNWVNQIPEKISNHSSFIAVGAAHLFGEKGLIQLLKQNGYTLQPIKM